MKQLLGAIFVLLLISSAEAQECWICEGGPGFISCAQAPSCSPGRTICDIRCEATCTCRLSGHNCYVPGPGFTSSSNGGDSMAAIPGARQPFGEASRKALEKASPELSKLMLVVLNRAGEFEEGSIQGLQQDYTGKTMRQWGFEAVTRISGESVVTDVRLANHPLWERVHVEVTLTGLGSAELSFDDGRTESISW